MKRVLVALVLGILMVAGWCAVAADDQLPKKLTPDQRKKLAEEGMELSKRGSEQFQTGKLVEAGQSFEEERAILRRLFPEADYPAGHPALAANLAWLAQVLKARGKYADAESLFRDALDMCRRLYLKDKHPNGTPELAAALNELGNVLMVRGKYADAEPLYRDALDMYRRLHSDQDHPDVAWSLNQVASVLAAGGRYADAEPLFRDALAMNRRLWPEKDHPAKAMSLGNLASALRASGRTADAEPLDRESLAMYRRLYPDQDHHFVAVALNNRAAGLCACGRITEAEALLRDALAMYRRLHPDQDHPAVAAGLNNLVVILRAGRKYADAEPLCREALAMYRRLHPDQDHPDVAWSLSMLSTVLSDRGRCADAEPLCRDAVAMYRRLYPDEASPDLAVGLEDLALVLSDCGKYADSEKAARDALAMSRQLYPDLNHPRTVQSLGTLAVVLMKRGKYADAEPLLHEALIMHRAYIEEYAMARTEGEALTLFAREAGLLDGYVSNARLSKKDPARVYRELWASKGAIARVFEQRQIAARAVNDPKTIPVLAELMSARRRRAELLLAPDSADPATRKKRRDDLEGLADEITKLDRDIRPLLPAVERATKLTKATPADLQEALQADAVVVDFLRFTFFEQDPEKPGLAGEKWTGSYLAFVVTKDKVSWIDLGSAKPLEDAVTSWRDAIMSGKDIPPEMPAKVREVVWEKVRKEFPDKVKVVYVSPDQPLCRVPWAALPGDKPGTILLEDYAVAVIPHATFLLDKLWPQSPLSNRPNGVLVVGGAAYDAALPAPNKDTANRSDPLLKPDQKFGWLALPGAEAEAKGVAGAAAKKKLDSRTLRGEEATADAVLAALPKARYAHLATHGFFADPSFRSAFHVDPDLFRMTLRGERVGAAALSPLVMTGLVFAGANKPNTPGRGVVTGEALVDLDLSGLDLAVLSACETGLGDVAAGEGTFGLQRAFHLAGTRDVVASLWKVPDRATTALMAEFYRNLWDKDMTPVEALRQAQLEIYRNPEKIPELAAGFRGKFEEVPGATEAAVKLGPDGKAHPLLWAAFTLSGPGR